MVSYLKNVEKHAVDISYFIFKLHNNIVILIWVALDPCPKKGALAAHFRLSNKVRYQRHPLVHLLECT